MCEWTEFAVDLDTTDDFRTACTDLVTLSHVTHLEPALQIARAGRLQPQLVFDESKLKEHRILVVWFSPNDWVNAGGFRYGGVRFQLDWERLLGDRRVYWVEAMKEYTPTACRLLLTEVEYEFLVKYDPTRGDGPWWHDTSTDEHFWNGSYCLEFMVEGEIKLEDCRRIDFVRHHPNRCNIDWQTCPERGRGDGDAGARFLARLAAEGIDLPAHLFREREGDEPHSGVENAASYLSMKVETLVDRCYGRSSAGSPVGKALARAVLNALYRFDEEAARLARRFRSKDELREACFRALDRCLGVEVWKDDR